MNGTNSHELTQTDDQNFTFVSLASAEKQFPVFVQTPTTDHILGLSLAALLSFEPQPDEPTDNDVLTKGRSEA